MNRMITFDALLGATLLAGSIPAAAGVALAQPAPAMQTIQQPPTPDADALAAAMRILGSNPRDLDALVTAGELSLRLGDFSGAAALFKRADAVDPMNGRVKAGVARILVQQERPGEALRYFDQAAGYGLDPRAFAGDRGLAYDLIGEQQRAQRDYRLALQAGPQDEVQRRLALSLAISGRQDEALREIEPLVRKSDRGAWRARAFILAMGGDVPGAEKIAATMMPSGMAAGLAPFFRRLPSLAPVDKAFAVHFGEVRPTAARLADARLTPSLPPLPLEASPPVRVAAVAPPPMTAKEAARERRGREGERERSRRAGKAPPVVLAAAPPPPVSVAPLPPPPRFPGNGVVFSAPTEHVQPLPATVAAPPPAAVAAASPAIPSPAPAPAPAPAAAPVPSPRVVAASPPVAPAMSEDSILARIIAGIKIPESELVERPARVAPPPPPVRLAKETDEPAGPAKTRVRGAKAASDSAETATTSRPARDSARRRKDAAVGEDIATADAPPARQTPAELRAERRAERKAAEAKKLAEAKKAAEAKQAAEEKKAARRNPARVWVQVAGGANAADLPKAWSAVKAKSSSLAGRGAYVTPLRATNRVVTGPFRTEAEARAFVNKLAKEGVPAFTFTSAPGQKLAKIPDK